MPHFTLSKTFLFNSYDLSEEDKAVFDVYLSVLEESGIHEIFEKELGEPGPKRGRPPYNPYKLFAAIAYAFSKHSGSLRKIEESLRYDMRFIYLMEGETPSHVTISHFLNNYIVKHQSEIFTKIVLAIARRYRIDLSDCFLDGTKLEANANKYKFVWKPTASHAKLIAKASALIAEHFGAEGLPKAVTALQMGAYLTRLKSEIEEGGLRAEAPGKGHRAPKIVKDYALLEKYMLKALEYEEKESICGRSRNSYYKTDRDATAMCLKEDYYSGLGSNMHAGYNVQIVVSKGLVIEYYVSQDRNDFKAFAPTLEKLCADYGGIPKRLCADSGYGSLENYEALAAKGIENYVKYGSWQMEVSGKRPSLYRFDGEGNLICLRGKIAREEAEHYGRHPKGKGARFYVIEGCARCRYKGICFEAVKDKKATSRVFEASKAYAEHKKEAMENLLSPKGIEMRVNRSAQVEGAFGVLKQDMEYDRVRRRGLENVSLETMMTLLGYNLRKLFRLITGKAKTDYWVAPEGLQAEQMKPISTKKRKKRKKGANEKLRKSYKRKKGR